MSERHFEWLTNRAREMRHEATPAESILWAKIRDRRLGGYRWKRQRPIDGYIADFYCSECRLVIELDGDSHGDDAARQMDSARTEIISRREIKVLRFRNIDVYEDVDPVLESILKECDVRQKKDPSPQPSPRVQGEGDETRKSTRF